MYADTNFYTSTYHGKLAPPEAEKYLARADFLLDDLTLGRLHTIDWKAAPPLAMGVPMAACALADLAHQQDTETAAGGQVVSETVGKWSRSVQANSESWQARYRKAAAQYLPARYNLLYRGVGVC